MLPALSFRGLDFAALPKYEAMARRTISVIGAPVSWERLSNCSRSDGLSKTCVRVMASIYAKGVPVEQGGRFPKAVSKLPVSPNVSGEIDLAVAASSGFVVVEQKLCERCGGSYSRVAGETCPYCPSCVVFFTALAEMERAAPPIDPPPTRQRRRGPKL
jgi:hypothetical protein